MAAQAVDDIAKLRKCGEPSPNYEKVTYEDFAVRWCGAVRFIPRFVVIAGLDAGNGWMWPLHLIGGPIQSNARTEASVSFQCRGRLVPVSRTSQECGGQHASKGALPLDRSRRDQMSRRDPVPNIAFGLAWNMPIYHLANFAPHGTIRGLVYPGTVDVRHTIHHMNPYPIGMRAEVDLAIET